MGSYRQVGYQKGMSQFFICGKCSKSLKGAGHHGKAKNRNNPAFWGIYEEQYKILCGDCLEENYQLSMPPQRKKEFKRYRKKGKL